MKNKADAFDVVVIGGGPAGYPAAIRAAQNQLSVACIDEWKNRDGSAAFGGTCLNAGCIPSKALLESTELYHRVHEEFAVHGIKVSGATLDLAQMQKRRSEEHTSELQSQSNLVCRLLLEKKKSKNPRYRPDMLMYAHVLPPGHSK